MEKFSMPVRVYIEDTDAGGVVYYANYLKYMERARTESLRAVGVNLDSLQREQRRLFVVRSVNLDYHLPARFDNELVVHANVVAIKAASLVLEQPIYCGEQLLLSATVKLACVDADSLAPTAIPNEIKEAITREL